MGRIDTQTLDGRPVTRSRGRADYLYFIIGSHDLGLSPSRHNLAGIEQIVLGRGAGAQRRSESELRIQVADGAMSSEHARLVHGKDGWTIQDLGSKNGVFVDGRRVDAALLEPGEVFELGRSFFLVSEHVAAGGPPDQFGPTLRDAALATLLPELEIDFARLLQIARSEVPVLITGETGTGKEVLTRAVHKVSGRSGACVAVNCGALPANLVESELFGYRKGAFSGALEDRPGLIRSAHDGTLFLDEIGELPAAAQVALLRALEQRAVVPVGGTAEIPTDFRLCCATHRNLPHSVRDEAFRSDLFGRIAGFVLELPPLRERLEDFGLIIRSLCARFRGVGDKTQLSNEAMRALFRHRWDQNIRELAKTLETALVLANGGALDIAHLPASLSARREHDEPLPKDDAALRARLIELLEEHAGNLSAVARALDKDRVQVRRWLQRFGVDLEQYRSR